MQIFQDADRSRQCKEKAVRKGDRQVPRYPYYIGHRQQVTDRPTKKLTDNVVSRPPTGNTGTKEKGGSRDGIKRHPDRRHSNKASYRLIQTGRQT